MDRRPKIAIASIALLLSLSGCGGGGSDNGGGATHTLNAGTWGATDAEFDASPTGDTLKEKCSSNSLPPVAIDTNGNWQWDGSESAAHR